MLEDILKKRDHLKQHASIPAQSIQAVFDPLDDQPAPIILRSSTINQELIHPPSSPEPSAPGSPEPSPAQAEKLDPNRSPSPHRRRFRPSLHIRKRSKNIEDPFAPPEDGNLSPVAAEGKRDRSFSGRLERLSLGLKSRSSSTSSVHVPPNLPDIPVTSEAAFGALDHEAEWEKRAALLATHERNRKPSAQSAAAAATPSRPMSSGAEKSTSISTPAQLAPADIDNQIQEAIALHEAGELERSTAIFRDLADPAGANNPFSQTLYGLALQHGWGCERDPPQALHYHTMAASNSASISLPSLSEKPTSRPATMATTTSARAAARGELVLAIYELGNAFRNGWGCEPDPVAARRYYETAAELGDVDSMQEAAWCYEHGYGGEKDKWRAARYLRMAEEKGVRMVGNSWIYKDKYMTASPGAGKKDKKVKEKDKEKEKEKH